MLLPDPTLRAPRRYALLALVIVLPAFALAGFALWTLRLDRLATEATERAQASALAQAIIQHLTNGLADQAAAGNWETDTKAIQIAQDTASDRLILVLDETNHLRWPRESIWPPVPQPVLIPPGLSDPESWHAAQRALSEERWSEAADLAKRWTSEWLADGGEGTNSNSIAQVWWLRAQAARGAGDLGLAFAGFLQVLRTAPQEQRTGSGLTLREAAAHALLDSVNSAADLTQAVLRNSPRSMLSELVEALTALESSPVSEAALKGFEELIPRWAAIRKEPEVAERFARRLERRNRLRQAHAALANPQGARSRSDWRESMFAQIGRETWVALRRAGDEGASTTVYELVPVRALREFVEQARRAANPLGAYGVSVRLAGPGFEVAWEEPSGIAARAEARASETIRQDLQMQVGVATLDPQSRAAVGSRRELLYGGLAVGTLVVSGVAAGLTWRVLVRQHRLGVQKSNFVASVSHELRAPLASVRLLTDNLEQGRVPDPERRASTLRLIGRECRRLAALVDNVLDLSRMDRGRRTLDREPTDVPALVREVVRVAASGAGERGVKVVLLVGNAAAGLVARVDGQALQQILTNLLDNALKHAPRESEVRVELEAGAGGRHFSIAVVDGGPGIPVRERTRVFEPFYRLGQELRREQTGVGIGLTIVRLLVEAHDGQVVIEDALPTGARFVVRLPVGLEGDGSSEGDERNRRA